MSPIGVYTIQQWLFDEAEGKFTVDLAESGIQYRYVSDLKINPADDLNYSLDRGKYRLRAVIADLYSTTVEQVVITTGAQEALYLFYRSYLAPGDHVIVFTPGWQQSWEVPQAIGAEVTQINLLAKEHYRLNLDIIKSTIKKNTRLIVFTNPCNPTGVKLTAQELMELKNLCESNDIFLLADEEYFTDYKNSIVNTIKKSGIVSSLSKVYGFPGLRLGWFIGEKEIVESIVNYKRYVTISNSSLCEVLAEQVLNNFTHYLDQYETIVHQGYQELNKWLSNESHLNLIKPCGTPFVYISLPNYVNSFQFCRELLKNHSVLLMPAEVFEDTNAIRISIGRESKILREGFAKISLQLKQVM